jgi:hypothetical protein
MEKENKPFSADYVLRTTIRHMQKAVNVSIDKTFQRVAEFANDPVKSQEVFSTLTALHAIKKQLDGSVNHNSGNK